MRINTENAQASIYCRETGEQVSFHCGLDLDWDDIRDLQAFFEKTMSVTDARDLMYEFEMFHGHADYDRVLIESTDENDRLQKIAQQLTVYGYDLFIDGISYE